MLAKTTFCLLLLSISLFAQGTNTYTYQGAPLPIFTDEANVVSVATIFVDRAYTVQSVTITVDVAYMPVQDINLYVYAPDLTRTKLLERNCEGTANATLVNISFADSGTTRYADFCPSEAGRGPFQGNEPLSNFNGKSSAGTWRLAVENNGSQNTGWLNSWSLTLTGGPVSVPTVVDVINRSSLKSGPVAPGSDIIAYGENLGPSTPAYAPTTGTLPTTLSGVQVLYNGTAMPLKAVYSRVVEAVIPWEASPGSKAGIQVVANGTRSNQVTVPVQASAPGLFSQGVVGDATSSWTIVKAVDQNYKVLNKDNPAVQGSVIIVYASGLGATTPAATTGTIPGSDTLYVVSTPTLASIGGQPATVQWAGLAPGFAGAYQVNIQVPTGLTSGLQNILLWSGGGTSQDNLQIWVQ